MDNENKTAEAQWGFTSNNTGTDMATPPVIDVTVKNEPEAIVIPSDKVAPEPTDAPDTMKRRGFFEAIKHKDCPQQRLADLLKEHELQTKEKIIQADALAEQRIVHLRQRIMATESNIEELKLAKQAAAAYKESTDEDLKILIQQLENEERVLTELQQKMIGVRLKLGVAKAGIVHKSLEDAELQIQMALNIQRNLYDETKRLNQQKFMDEKDHLAQLSTCYQQLYNTYEKRYQRVDKYLTVLDVDGISPVTTRLLTTIGTIAFGAAGFFFSTFAGNTGFGNQDMLYFILVGIFDTAKQPMAPWLKVGMLLLILGLITAVSVGCNYLIARLKRNSDEEILSEVSMDAAIAKKLKQLDYQATIKSNNWYGFWLQLVPILLILGLIVLGIAHKATGTAINAINTSSEGLIVGTSIAIAFAGLVYLYVIKIVEPRLVKWYDAHTNTKINWMRANWELMAIVVTFLVFVLCIIFIPYDKTGKGLGVMPSNLQTNFSLLIFAAICLVGGTSFAYGIRSRGLIETNRRLEDVMCRLKSLIAYCNAPVAPKLHNEVAEEHSNVIQHVLKQLSFKATLNKEEVYYRIKKKRDNRKNWFDRLFGAKDEPAQMLANEPIQMVTIIQPWEERYFPQIIDELKATEFEYREQKARATKACMAIENHRAAITDQVRLLNDAIQRRAQSKTQMESEIEDVMGKKQVKKQQILNSYNKLVVDLLDGFHLGLWYRENGLGPANGFFEAHSPLSPQPTSFISAQ